MKHRYIIIDGVLNSTGIRDEFEGYIKPQELNLPNEFIIALKNWLTKYEKTYYLTEGEIVPNMINELDNEGINLAKELKNYLGDEYKIKYHSDALQKTYLI